MIDLLICSVPSGIINRPPAAPALLKGCALQAGFTAKTLDLSLLLYNDFCESDYFKFDKVNRLFEPDMPWEHNLVVSQWLQKCLAMINKDSPRFLGISVFSVAQHRATFLICQAIKKHCPDIPIILGGFGLPEKYHWSFNKFIDAPLGGIEKFGDFLRREKLADFFIYGEGEQQLVDILSGNAPDATPIDLEHIPLSNFDDYEMEQYLWHNEPVLTITGSKGCVRKCRFCNVPQKFGKYRQRSGQHIANEIIQLSQRYNIYKFEFTDSLVNGNLKEFMEMISILADYNSQCENKVTWYGQYICRPQNQIPTGMYTLIKQSGALHLIIGAESGSDAVLEAMNKKITVKDIFDELDQFEKHDLQCQLLMLTGYYNETWDRFLETLQFICRCHRYIAAGVISKIVPGPPLFIEEGGYLHVHSDDLGIVIDKNDAGNWTTKDDPTFTWLERCHRKGIVHALLYLMNVSMSGNSISETQQLIEKLKIYEQQLLSNNSNFNFGMFESVIH